MSTGKKRAGSGFYFWLLVWSLGLAGQLCWNMENQWFNTFVYTKIAKDPTIISWMVAISATATTISTFLFGCVADRRGKRRPFIAVGYILWGIFTIVFGLTEFLSGGLSGETGALVAVGFAVVAADAVMSFFGSMGNDIGYNAWINDNMNDKNRGQLGAALAVQPVLGTIVGTVAGGMLVGADNNYIRLFVVMGGIVILLGVLCLFTLKEAPELKPSVKGSFSHQFFSIFNVREYMKLKELVMVNLTLAVYFISFNVYFAHLGNYMIYYLGFTADIMGYIEGLALGLAMLATIPASGLINKGKSPMLTAVSVVISCIGLILLGFGVSPASVDPTTLWNPFLLFSIFLVGLGYVLFLQTITVWSKQLYPEDARGQFEGIRILFFVLIPMIIAPLISNPIIKKNGAVLNDFGIQEFLPNDVLFRVSSVLVLLTFIPLFFAWKHYKKR